MFTSFVNLKRQSHEILRAFLRLYHIVQKFLPPPQHIHFLFKTRFLPLTPNLGYCTSCCVLVAAGCYSYRKIYGFPTFQYLAGGTHPLAQTQWGVKMRSAIILPAATIVSGRKNTQIYIIERAKRLCSGKCNSRDFVLGVNNEHGVWRRKFKNFT
jgi:hypothetical protein